jgi:hydrogenase maturation protease
VNGLQAQRALVLGIGNTLLGDEGAGVHALSCVRQRPESRRLELVDAGTLSFTLLPVIEQYSWLIVLDAAQFGAAPGTVRVVEGASMDQFLSRPRRSVHEVGICDLLHLTRLTGRFPAHRALIGIEPAMIGWHDGPSREVAAALEEAADEVLSLVARWRETPDEAAA